MKKTNKVVTSLIFLVIVLILIIITISFINNRSKIPEIIPRIEENIEKAPIGPQTYLNVDNISELTGKKVIESPNYSEEYNYGDIIPIKWNPELIDVSTISLRQISTSTYDIQIFRREKYDESISINGRFDYRLPYNLNIYPGKYRIQLNSYKNKDSYLSDEFIIKSPVKLMNRINESFKIISVNGANQFYKQGDLMKLNIEALEGDNTFADNEKGFNIQARLFDINNRSVWSGNAQYENNVKTWHLEIPIMKDTYRAQIILYCSNSNIQAICAQKYDPSLKVEQYINFTIK